MRTTSLALLLSGLAALVAAQGIQDLPACATQCFGSAIASSDCGLTDNYCQCTTGAQQIRADTISCLCKSECTATELMKAQQVSNGICSSALAASSETYSATSLGVDVCQSQPTGGSGSGTGTAASNEASATGESDSSGSDSSSASASASSSVEAQSGNAAAPATTGMVGFQGAVLGVVGLGLMAL